jgi:Ca2+/Na+ antiporter
MNDILLQSTNWLFMVAVQAEAGVAARTSSTDWLGLPHLLHSLLGAAIFTVLGLVIFAISMMVVSRVVPFSLRKEIEEDQNVAVGVMLGAMMIGISIIIAAAIAS